MQQIRAFIAIELPEDARRALGDTARRLAEQLPQGSVRWVRPELIHLTLRFLGDTAVAKLPTIAAALDALGAQHAPFTLALSEAGCFPNRKRPRIIWAGLDGQLAPLQALKRDLDRALAASGWELEDRPFQPHLTLGRVKDSRLLQGVAWQASVERVGVPVTAVVLMESELTRSGPVYTRRHASALQQQAAA